MYKMVCVNGYNYMGVYYLFIVKTNLIHLDDGGCGCGCWLWLLTMMRLTMITHNSDKKIQIGNKFYQHIHIEINI